ncbi:hypothetical protein [Parasediminibacterium sp. JCM 36343]|uniref:hypothetical protein n=1 Tax=Parasediminibacterium sp. JCM 36343 TaxID=3374279 RepID=UPI0039788667
MKHLNYTILLTLTFIVTLTSCRKDVPAGTTIYISGIVFDSVKNKTLPNAKLYLFGAEKTFYGIYYVGGPYDSVTTDANGKFSLQYKAEGKSVDYGLSLGELNYGGYNYRDNENYVIDNYYPMFKLNYSTNTSNAVARARELNYSKIHLKVLNNPYDSFYIRTYAQYKPILIIGQSIDTTVVLRHLPNQLNSFQYYTEAYRDTIGLAALNSNPNGHSFSIRRMLNDSFTTNMDDTIFINKTILNSLSMPRQ